MGTIKILNAGLLSTVQDLGRYGYQRYGVSPSGVMDEFGAKIANKLVGNDKSEALLETTAKGVDVEFLKDTIIAITGGECDIALDGKKINLWVSYKVKAGQVLKMGFCKYGLRNYIAFLGGIDVPLVMGSRATNLKAKLGGFEGRKLEKGDILKTKEGKTISLKSLKEDLIPKYEKEIDVRVILGQQDDSFTASGIKIFFKETYEITQESDRMGMRLESHSGNKIEHKESADMISDGITFGAIQVPGSGQPIIMMADRQTTGGYTKIGNIISSDLPKLAQATPGTNVNFIEYSLEQGVNFLKEMNAIIEDEKSYEEIKEGSKRYQVTVDGKVFDVIVEEA